MTQGGRMVKLHEVLQRSLAALRGVAPFETAAIYLVEEGGLAVGAADPPASLEARTTRTPLGHGAVGRIAATGEPLEIADTAADPAAVPQGVRPGARSFLGVPLRDGDETIGVLEVDSSKAAAFSREDQRRILTVAAIVASTVRAALLFERERGALERLREADRLRTELLSLISHELKTPLAFVLGVSETLATRVEDLDGATIAELSRRMRRATGRLDRIIDDLLEASRIEHRGLRAELRPIAVEPVVRQVVVEARTERQIVEVIEPGVPAVRADPDRLAQVLTNLLSNALKFSDGPVRVEVRRERDAVAIAVRDEGPGIPTGLHERVFSPFFRAAKAGGTEGLGVGLYLVYEICRAMGATLSLESEPGRGSTFTVRLTAAGSDARGGEEAGGHPRS